MNRYFFFNVNDIYPFANLSYDNLRNGKTRKLAREQRSVDNSREKQDCYQT